MYISPLYGKEWHWRNVKMEAQDQNMNKRLTRKRDLL
jgi:hypothetical protein